MADVPFRIERGRGPLVATAIHAGHEVRDEVLDFLALDERTRRHEEDPYTGEWTTCGSGRVVVNRSRFEVDLNRPREHAVYVHPGDAWGLEIWKKPPPAALVSQSLAIYDEFYDEMREMLTEVEQRHGGFVLLDLHSYNYRRRGPDQPSPPEENPEVNIGTGTMNRARWGHVVDAVIDTLRHQSIGVHPLDVRENVRFLGGQLCRWVHENFPETGCAIALELKKIYMDEWTGRLYPRVHEAIRGALAAVEGPVEHSLHEDLMPVRR